MNNVLRSVTVSIHPLGKIPSLMWNTHNTASQANHGHTRASIMKGFLLQMYFYHPKAKAHTFQLKNVTYRVLSLDARFVGIT